MKDQFVKFETAKLATEKGFCISCNNYYSTYYSPYFGGTTGETNLITKEDKRQEALNESYNKYTLAPTQSLLQKWLRETHDIHICIDSDIYPEPHPSGWKYRFTLNHCRIQTKESLDLETLIYESYEECLEFALIEGLKLVN